MSINNNIINDNNNDDHKLYIIIYNITYNMNMHYLRASFRKIETDFITLDRRIWYA